MSISRSIMSNSQWLVTNYGLEFIKENTYDIPKESLFNTIEEQNIYDWPVHIAEKEWVDIKLFLEAFSFAMDYFSKELEKEVKAQYL